MKMKTINTVVPDVYKMMEDKVYTGDLQKIADIVGKEVSDAIVDAMTAREHKPGLRMSGIGRCERAQWYKYKGYTEEPISGQVFLTFLQGHILEAVLLGLVELSGHKVTGKQGKHTVEGVNGSQDCEIDGELVDVKTASAWSYDNKFKDDGIKDDAFGYIKQLSAYGKTKGRDKGYFLAFNKNKATLKLCEQQLEQDVDKHITQLQEKMELDTEPMRLANATLINKKTGEERLCMNCSFCGFKDVCYNNTLTSRPTGKIMSYFIDPIAGNF
jgi:hypothetical protein